MLFLRFIYLLQCVRIHARLLVHFWNEILILIGINFGETFETFCISQVQHNNLEKAWSIIFWSDHMGISYVNMTLHLRLLWRVLKLITHIGYLIHRQVFGVLCQICQGVAMYSKSKLKLSWVDVYTLVSGYFPFAGVTLAKGKHSFSCLVVMLLQESSLIEVEWPKFSPWTTTIDYPKI